MQFRFVAGVFFVFFTEIHNLYGPRHAARAQHIDDAEMIEANVKAELLKASGVSAGGYFGLKNEWKGKKN